MIIVLNELIFGRKPNIIKNVILEGCGRGREMI